MYARCGEVTRLPPHGCHNGVVVGIVNFIYVEINRLQASRAKDIVNAYAQMVADIGIAQLRTAGLQEAVAKT